MDRSEILAAMAEPKLYGMKVAYDAIIGQFGGKPAARSLPGLFDPRIKIGPPRSPLKVISDDDLAGLKAALQSAGFLPKSEL